MCVYHDAVNVVPLQVGSRRLQQPPVATFIVADVRLDLVVLSPVGDHHAFDSGHLTDRHRHRGWRRSLSVLCLRLSPHKRSSELLSAAHSAAIKCKKSAPRLSRCR